MSGANYKKQEYLAEAYRIAYYQDEGDPYVATSAIAEEMGVSAPAVTRMVQRLQGAGYVIHEPYRGVRLTPAGEREALRSIRRHRIVERFLVDVMQFGWHEVHDYADELDVAVSDSVVNRMDQMAGFPRRCPHGEPIPTADLKMPRIKDDPMHAVTAGPGWAISRVHTHDAHLLEYLNTLGLKPGMPFDLIDKAPFNGPIQLRFNGAVQHIGYEIAQVMMVCPVDQFELAGY
jgi:DtxR family transcriptional regulator, Mn-dependent transcriptional regulator